MKRFTTFPALFGRFMLDATDRTDQGEWNVTLMLLPSEAVRMAFALLWGAACTVVRGWFGRTK